MRWARWIIIILAALIAGLILFAVFAPERTEMPGTENPANGDTGSTTDNGTDTPMIPVSRVGELSDLVTVDSPRANEEILSPIVVSGTAPGNWFFEADAPVAVVNWDGLIIGEGYITAQGDWMTTDLVPFTGSIEYDLPADSYSNRGALILQRANPSDLPANDAAVEIPIMLVPAQ